MCKKWKKADSTSIWRAQNIQQILFVFGFSPVQILFLYDADSLLLKIKAHELHVMF